MPLAFPDDLISGGGEDRREVAEADVQALPGRGGEDVVRVVERAGDEGPAARRALAGGGEAVGEAHAGVEQPLHRRQVRLGPAGREVLREALLVADDDDDVRLRRQVFPGHGDSSPPGRWVVLNPGVAACGRTFRPLLAYPSPSTSSRSPSDVMSRWRGLGWKPRRSAARVTTPWLGRHGVEDEPSLELVDRLVVRRHRTGGRGGPCGPGSRRRGLEQRLREVLRPDRVPWPRTTARSIALPSSRTLPGQS